MTKCTSNSYCGSHADNDSGIGFDHDYSSSSSAGTFAKSSPKMTSFPLPGLIGRKRVDRIPLIRFPSDGIIERIRPVTMRNSENSDFIICQTNRGNYIAHRTSIVPSWITKLVHDIELREK